MTVAYSEKIVEIMTHHVLESETGFRHAAEIKEQPAKNGKNSRFSGFFEALNTNKALDSSIFLFKKVLLQYLILAIEANKEPMT
jgi:hypothetical protein